MAKKDFMNLMKEKTTDLKPSLLSAEEDIKARVLIIDQLRDLIPPLGAEELAQLEQNIVTHGIKDPLSIWETTSRVAGIDDNDTPVFVLIDGHNRYQLAQTRKLDFRINLMRFARLEEVKDYMIGYQLGRRNLTPEQASYLRGMRYIQQKSMRGSNLQAEGPQVNVAEALAAEHRVSSRTIKRDGEFAAGIEKLTPDLKREVLAGKQKLSKAAVHALVKPNSSEPVAHAGARSASLQDAKTEAHDSSDEVNDQVDILQRDIRKLANGPLNRRSCSQLIKKITELTTLHSSK